jgi:hypothetical protein
MSVLPLKLINVVVTGSDKCLITIGSNTCPILTHTKQLFIDYAIKVGADFKIITSYDLEDDCIYGSESSRKCIIKMKIVHDCLLTYKRIILFDNTCCISHQTPNLFNIVAENEIGGQQEGLLDYMSSYKYDYEFIKTKMDFQINRCKYISGSMLIISKAHQSLFDNRSINENLILFQSNCPQQTFLNYIIQKNSPRLKLLSVKWCNPRVFENRFAGEQNSRLILDSNYVKKNYIMNVSSYYTYQMYYITQVCDIYYSQK